MILAEFLIALELAFAYQIQKKINNSLTTKSNSRKFPLFASENGNLLVRLHQRRKSTKRQ